MLEYKDAPCLGQTEIFFNNRNKRKKARAKQICFKCPHKKECGEWAIHNHIFYGVWGGMDMNEIEVQRRIRDIVLPEHYGYTRGQTTNRRNSA
tara:strand:- start:458 stop:736 length:279 start_codon:yes stop_codon:yes gene_type:complete